MAAQDIEEYITNMTLHIEGLTGTTMDKNDMLTLHNAGIVRKVNRKRIIHISDSTIQYVYFLRKGIIKISTVNNRGEEFIKYFLKSGSFFGELNLLGSEEDSHEIAVAIEESEICFIPADTVKQLMISHLELNKSITSHIGFRLKKSEERALSLVYKSVKERILDFLREFVRDFGHPVAGGYAAMNFLTHEDIARVTGTSRQSVTTTLLNLKKEGNINYSKQTLSVFNHIHPDTQTYINK